MIMTVYYGIILSEYLMYISSTRMMTNFFHSSQVRILEARSSCSSTVSENPVPDLQLYV